MSLKMKYFVLKPSGDDQFAAASRKAMCCYAYWIQDHAENEEDRQFAKELYDWAALEVAEAAIRRKDNEAQKGQKNPAGDPTKASSTERRACAHVGGLSPAKNSRETK